MTDARFRLRAQLGDLATDKFVFKSLVYPTPDGVNTVFHTGDTNLVADTLSVNVSGVPTAVSGTPNWAQGTFELNTPPLPGAEVTSTYLYQWFTDEQIDAFLLSGVNTIGVESIDTESLVFTLRPAVLLFSAYYAYMQKAAEVAHSLVASAEGYQTDQSKSFPNWKRLAENAWAQAKAAVEFYNLDLLNAGGTGIAIKTYFFQPYMPGS